MTKYAKILDSTWWEEDVPVGFKDRSVLDYTVDEENPTETVLKWKEYLTQGGRIWKKQLFNEENEVTHEFAIFSRNGRPVDVPEDYSNDKLEMISDREYKIYTTNDYLIHLYTDYPLGTNPKHIDFNSELKVGLTTRSYKWKGQILTKTFEIDGLAILEKEYSHTRTNGLKTSKTKKFYWYKADGTKECLKQQDKDIPVKSDQVADLIKQTNNAIEEAYAFTVGTPIQPFADAYFLTHADKVEQDKRTGGTLFKDQIASEVYDVNNTSTHFLFSFYDTSHLTHNHELGESPTIQQVLVDYLTFE